MQIQSHNSTPFKGKIPFSSPQQRTAIIKKLNRENIDHKVVGSEILTGRSLTAHVKERVADIKNTSSLKRFEDGVKQAIANFRNRQVAV